MLVVEQDVFPQTLAVVQTRAEPLGLRVVVTDLSGCRRRGERRGGCWPRRRAMPGVFGVLTQYPSGTGAVRDLTPLVSAAHGPGWRSWPWRPTCWR